MFLLGVLSFFQIVCIPGFLILELLKIETESRLQRLVYVFGLSLTVNYLGVYFLTVLGLYRPVTVFLIVAVEVAGLVYCFVRRKPSFRIESGSVFDRFRRMVGEWSLLHVLVYLAALGVLGFYFYLLVANFGAIFKGWDVVYGWDRFAKDWFAGMLPERTAHYPQLLPANWSISYMLIGTAAVNVFARAVMPLFTIAVLLLFLDLGLRKKQAVYFGGAVIYGLMVRFIYLPEKITSGYADLPVAFFAFLAFYVLHSAEIGGGWNARAMLLSTAFASAGAVTKQAGMYMLVVVLVWNVAGLLKNRAHERPVPGREVGGSRQLLKSFLLMFLVVLLIFGSWYIYKEIQISQGLDRSEVHHVTQRIFKGKTHGQRMTDAFAYLYNYKPGVKGEIILLAPLLVLLGLFHRRSRVIALTVVIPFTLIWSAFFSYDHRNLTLTFPFFAFVMAFGTVTGWGFVEKRLKKFSTLNINGWLVLALFAVVLVALNFTVFQEKHLRDNQLQRQLMQDPALEQLLVNRYEGPGLQGKIYTPYRDLHRHPLLKYYAAPQQGVLTMKKLETILKQRKKIFFLLIHTQMTDRKVLQYIDEKVRSGELIHAFTHKKVWKFIEMRKLVAGSSKLVGKNKRIQKKKEKRK